MEASHHLKELLQLQLASDSYAVLHLPFVLETLTKSDFSPSPHTSKWIARVNSLIHSKDPAAKWSGLCLAYQTATYSKDILLECAQSWLGAAMPLLVNQPPPTTKAAIRLLQLMLSDAVDVPEFQRQISIPNVPKYVNALIAVVDKGGDPDTSLLAIDTLSHIVNLYPSLCRPLHGVLSNVALRYLNGSAPTPTPSDLVEACSRLYAVLPHTGGKVNAPNLWRKSLDDTLAFAWGAFLQLRTTYPDRGYGRIARTSPPTEDPVVAVPLALDRLRAAVRVLKDHLRANASRPVSLPIGPLVLLCSALLECSLEDKHNTHADHVISSLEACVVPAFWGHAYELLACVSKTGKHHLTPHAPLLLTHLAHHLEHPRKPADTILLLRAVLSLVSDGCQLHDNIVASRLARAVMSFLTVILSPHPQSSEDAVAGTTSSKSRKGKKRARGYEGDEVFKVGGEVVCRAIDDGLVLLASVDVLESLLARTPVNPPVHSIASRLLLSIYASLPRMPPALLSPDLSLHSRLYSKVQQVCVNLAIGTTSTMSKSLGLVLSVADGTLGEHDNLLVPAEVDLLLHPRVPPLVRSLPHVELLSLFRAEEGEEEADARRRVGLGVLDERVVGPSDAAESLTPPAAVGERTLNFPPPPLEAAKITGKTSMQGSQSVTRQIDPPLALSAFSSSGSQTLGHSGPLPQSSLEPPASRAIVQNSLPPPPDPLPPNSAALGSRSATAPVNHAPPAPVPMGLEKDDDDEPMPTIDLGSDSDSE